MITELRLLAVVFLLNLAEAIFPRGHHLEAEFMTGLTKVCQTLAEEPARDR